MSKTISPTISSLTSQQKEEYLKKIDSEEKLHKFVYMILQLKSSTDSSLQKHNLYNKNSSVSLNNQLKIWEELALEYPDNRNIIYVIHSINSEYACVKYFDKLEKALSKNQVTISEMNYGSFTQNRRGFLRDRFLSITTKYNNQEPYKNNNKEPYEILAFLELSDKNLFEEYKLIFMELADEPHNLWLFQFGLANYYLENVDFELAEKYFAMIITDEVMASINYAKYSYNDISTLSKSSEQVSLSFCINATFKLTILRIANTINYQQYDLDNIEEIEKYVNYFKDLKDLAINKLSNQDIHISGLYKNIRSFRENTHQTVKPRSTRDSLMEFFDDIIFKINELMEKLGCGWLSYEIKKISDIPNMSKLNSIFKYTQSPFVKEFIEYIKYLGKMPNPDDDIKKLTMPQKDQSIGDLQSAQILEKIKQLNLQASEERKERRLFLQKKYRKIHGNKPEYGELENNNNNNNNNNNHFYIDIDNFKSILRTNNIINPKKFLDVADEFNFENKFLSSDDSGKPGIKLLDHFKLSNQKLITVYEIVPKASIIYNYKIGTERIALVESAGELLPFKYLPNGLHKGPNYNARTISQIKQDVEYYLLPDNEITVEDMEINNNFNDDDNNNKNLYVSYYGKVEETKSDEITMDINK